MLLFHGSNSSIEKPLLLKASHPAIDKKFLFLVFDNEQYRSKFGISANSTYNLFKEKGIFDYINDTFEAIHTLDSDLVVSEIEGIVRG